MSQRARAAKLSAAASLISPSKSKKKSIPNQTITHAATVQKKTPVKKSSPIKRRLEPSSSPPRKKRLASLTAATLLQYCTNILSPSSNKKRQVDSSNSSPISRNNQKKKNTKQSSKDNENIRPSRRRTNSKTSQQIANTQTELNIRTRTHREASSRASAMIMQQNEIERSRFNYSLANERSISTNRRRRTKSKVSNKDDIQPEQSFQFNIPSIPPLPTPVPSVSNITEYAGTTNSTYPSLTEAILAEHDRLHGTTPPYHTTKRDNLIKWTQELVSYDPLSSSSSSFPEHDIPPESFHGASSIVTNERIQLNQDHGNSIQIGSNKTSSTSTIVVDASINSKSTAATPKPINMNVNSIQKNGLTKKEVAVSSSIADPSMANISSSRSLSPAFEHNHRHSLTTNNVTIPAFLSSSAAFPIDLRSFYPLLPCWQYPAWTFETPPSLHNQTQPLSLPLPVVQKITRHRTTTANSDTKTKKSTTLIKQQSIVPISKQESELLSPKKEALTFHLHTHHHHHIHNPNPSPPSFFKSLKTTTISLSPDKSSVVINQEQPVETKLILPLSVNNVVKKEHIATTTENEALNFSIKHLSKNQNTTLNEQIITIKKTTRRKSSPVKRRVSRATKSNSSLISSIGDKPSCAINSISNNLTISPSNHRQLRTSATILSQVSNIHNSNGDSPAGGDDSNPKSSRRLHKLRSVSAATTTVSLASKTLRGKRTHSASTIPIRSKSLINRKRSQSSTSIGLPVSNKSGNQRKKQKVSHYWALFGKSERKLVLIDADKPPVYRKCYSSIRHIKEKDIIKSNDCVLLRPDTATRNGATPYLAKVKWFWEEPISNEIQMSLIWYYHPEHTELPLRIKERFLPNELLASKYRDCVNVACIEDKCYVLNVNEYNRYCLREKAANLFEHSESVDQLKSLLNKNTSTIHHRPLPSKIVDNQNIFFCRYVYDYRANRILKNPITTTSVPTTSNV